MKKLRVTHKIFVMALICLLFAYGIWNWTEKQIGYYLGEINSGLEQIAQVQTKSNQVIRNQSGQLLWQDIDVGEPVYIGNSIQTEKNSSTEIIMNDGEKILIGPESLVRFSKTEDKISLQLIDGKMEIKTDEVAIQEVMRIEPKKTKKLVVKTPRGQLHVNNSSVKLKVDKNDEKKFKVEVIKGAPELVTEAKEKEVLTINSPGQEKIDVLKIEEPVADIKPVRENLASQVELQSNLLENNLTNKNDIAVTQELAPEQTELSPNSTQTIISGVNPETGAIERKPARAVLSAPKVKNIKIKEVE